MSFFTNTATNATTTNASQTAEKDVEVADPPTDSISSLSFSSQADYLAVGSWDNSVRIYEVGAGGQTQGKAMYQHQGPVLDVCWNKVWDLLFITNLELKMYRMAQKYSLEALTTLVACLM